MCQETKRHVITVVLVLDRWITHVHDLQCSATVIAVHTAGAGTAAHSAPAATPAVAVPQQLLATPANGPQDAPMLLAGGPCPPASQPAKFGGMPRLHERVSPASLARCVC